MSVFSVTGINNPKRNKFNLSHERKMSLEMGKLVPIYLEEIIPGDKFRVKSETLLRFSPLIAPVMHRINCLIDYFFVPNRLVWDEWEDFITGGEDGLQAPAFPTMRYHNSEVDAWKKGTVADYFGIPVPEGGTIATGTNISSLPFKAYQLIYNEFYRDQNLETKIPIDTSSGAVPTGDIITLTELLTRAWEKDYFTSALPWTQRGGDVEIPVKYKTHTRLLNEDGTEPTPPVSLSGLASGGETWLDGNGNWLQTDNVSGINIEELRRSARLQEWLERQARAGSRYIETILSHFGVRSKDYRLQRPELLSSSMSPVVISEVLNTTGLVDATNGGNLQGQMAGHGLNVGRSHGFKRGFTEHGYIIGIMTVIPKTAYQQGIHRSFRKFDKYDYFWPEFAHLGEQAIEQMELYYNHTDGTNINSTFGYQQRYAEYKYAKSHVSGDFRDNLNYWHQGRIFTSEPALNEDFVKSSPDPRIFAVTDPQEHKIYAQIYNKVDALRPMPYISIPKL